MKKIVNYHIKFCNNCCPNFYHNFDDGENIWCVKLRRKIFDFAIEDNTFADYKERPFPKECPLESDE